jgi:hypothetical protein
MENLIVYLIKSATLLLLFYSTYYFLLKKNTFFTTNRWFLLFGLFCAAFLPLLSFQKIVWVEPVISSVDTSNFEVITTNSMVNLPLPVEENFLISWEMVVGLLYGIGVLVFLTQLLVEFYSLRKIIKRKSKIKVDGFELIEVQEAIAPFSFFKKIVYNRNLFQPEELRNIIEHEKIHAKQLHSLDVLIARIYCIVFWWNPVVWFYKNVMVQNLEFIADHNALAKAKDKKSYLLTLLKITTAEKHVAITNHFYQSLIKKRIVMLHTNQSKKYHSWRYFIVLPALVFFMLTYQVEVVAQEKQSIIDSENQKLSLIELEIEAQTTDKELKEASMLFNQEFGITLEYSKLKRNKKGDIIAIKVALKDKNSKSDIKRVYETLGDTPIKSFKVYVGADPNGKVEFGYGESEYYRDLVTLDMDSSDSIPVRMDAEDPKIISTSKMYSNVISAYSINLVLDNLKIFYEMHFGIDMTFNNITRNKENEITGIDVTLTNKKGTSYDYKVSSNKPIKPFSIFATVEKDENQKFGFSTSVDYNDLKKSIKVFEQNKISSNSKQLVLSIEEQGGKYKIKSTPESDLFNGKVPVKSSEEFLKNTLIIIDGKVTSNEDYYKMDPNSIKSVTVVKRARNDIAQYEELFKKYGERAEDGIIEIKTNDFQEPVEKDNSGWGMSFKTTKPKDNIALLKENKDIDYKKAFISLDGKEISSSEMEKVKPRSIETSVTFEKGNPKAILKYGEKARNGAIIIETRGYKAPKLQKKVEKAGTTFKLDPENGSFIIHKRSKRSNIEFYEKYLAEIGIKAEIEGIERNPKGFIMSIKFKLMDELLKTNMDEWQTFSNPKGIPDIIIGRKNGKILLSAK